MQLREVKQPRIKQLRSNSAAVQPEAISLAQYQDEIRDITGNVTLARDEAVNHGQSVDFTDATVIGSDLSGLHVRYARRTRFSDCKMVGTQFDGSVIDCMFTHSRIDMASFRFCKIERARFEDCSISETDFYRAELSHVAIFDSKFRGIGFDQAQINVVDLRRSVLEIGNPATIEGVMISMEQAIDMCREMAQCLGIVVGVD